VLDELASCRVADDLDHLRLHDGSDERQRVRIFTGQWIVIQRSRVAVQIPLAGLVQGLEHVAQIIAKVLFPEVHRAAVRAVKTNHAPRRVDFLDTMKRGCPRAEQHDVDVGRVGPGGVEIARGVNERLTGIFARCAALGAAHSRAPIRSPRSHPRMVVHVQREKPPALRADQGQIQFVIRLAGRLPPSARQAAPAAQHGPLTGIRPNGHRRFRGPRVFGAERQLFGKWIHAAVQVDVYRSRCRPFGSQLTDRCHRSRDRRKGPGLAAVVSIVARGRDMEIPGGGQARRAADRQQRDNVNQECTQTIRCHRIVSPPQ